VLLSALKTCAPPERDEVLLPSYTCYSVPASVARAGLRVRVVDVSPETLDFDLERLGNADFRRVLAVVPTSLYGLPSQLDRIAGIAADRRVFLVDDAAQALGAAVGGRPAGGWGDAGLVSFDKGKAVSAIDGGAIVANVGPVAEAVERAVRSLGRHRFGASVEGCLKAAVYAGCLRPSLYWLPNSLPGLRLGRTEYRVDFPVRSASPLLAALGVTMWPKLAAFVSARVANARQYLSALPANEAIVRVSPVEHAQPSYLRLPVLARTRELRNRLLDRLHAVGVGATGSYPGSIADIPAIQSLLAAAPDATVGRSVAGRIITLPTHPYVSGSDIERAIAVLRQAAETA
jgi:dTDP-4-amino-4,6-dideoxygalactose transaminase